MEEENDEFNIQEIAGKEEEVLLDNEPHKNIWRVLSFISWVLLVTSQLNSVQLNMPLSIIDIVPLKQLYDEDNEYINYNYFPQKVFLILSLIGFVNYLIYTFYLVNENVCSGLFDNFAKFHFLPFLIVSSLYIMTEAYGFFFFGLHLEDSYLIYLIFNAGFSLIGLVLLIIVYVKTKLSNSWHINFFIKKGVYSSLIMLLWGNILLDVYIFTIKSEIVITIIIPTVRTIGAIIFSLIFKDIIVLFINLLYNLNTIANHYKYSYVNDKTGWIGEKIGYISLIMIFLTLLCMLFLIIKFKERLFQ